MTSLYAPAITEDILNGDRMLRRAFLDRPRQSIQRNGVVVRAGDPDPPIVLIQRSLAYCAQNLPDGRRAILDILVPGDVAGLDLIVHGGTHQEVIAASNLEYRSIQARALQGMMSDRAVAIRVLSLMAETRRRKDRHLTAITRFDARERLALFLLDIHDRLRRRELIARPTFNLPLIQEQIADHLGMTMVHVNRTFRQLREDRLVLVAQQVVIITDLDRLRAVVSGMPPLADTSDGLEREPLRDQWSVGPSHSDRLMQEPRKREQLAEAEKQWVEAAMVGDRR
jgi:CRP-like cAMP-binding protein